MVRPESESSVSNPNTETRTYVLVHGAWYGGWVWRDVAPALRRQGHDVFCPTLTGLGSRRHLLSDAVDLETHVTDVVSDIETEDLHDIHLVGWSYGGMVATGVLARVRERVASMIYLDAFVPENGKSLADYADEPARDAFLAAEVAREPVSHIPFEVFGVHDADVIAFCEPRMALQPWRCPVQPVTALATRPPIPHTYIRCAGFDPSPFEQFLRAFEGDPAWDTHVLDTNHLAPLTAPDDVVRLLLAAR